MSAQTAPAPTARQAPADDAARREARQKLEALKQLRLAVIGQMSGAISRGQRTIDIPTLLRELGDSAGLLFGDLSQDAALLGRPPMPTPARAPSPSSRSAGPSQIPELRHPPTAEQAAILECFRQLNPGEVLTVRAFAGTGKTTTLEALGREALVLAEAAGRRPPRGIYLAFNKSIADTAKPRFRKVSVEARTTHSLALSATFGSARVRFIGMNSRTVRDFVGQPALFTLAGRCRKDAYTVGMWVSLVVEAFCNSDADSISGAFANRILGEHLSPEDRARLDADAVAALAREVWGRIGRLDAEEITHSAYLKLFEQSPAAIQAAFAPFSHVYVDEAQDLSPVQISILRTLIASGRHGIVLVGDSKQQIYGWRYAVDALDALPARFDMPLTESWRFSAEIADLANRVLAEIPDPAARSAHLVTGRGPNLGIGGQAILCRTNAGILQAAFQSAVEGMKVHVIGGIQELEILFNDAQALYEGRSRDIRGETIRRFDHWQELRMESEMGTGSALKLIVREVEDGSWEEKLTAIRAAYVERRETADIVVGTPHRAKGDEFAAVGLWDDFPSLDRLRKDWETARESGDEAGMRSAVEAFHVLYVALTRAAVDLSLPPSIFGVDASQEDDEPNPSP